MHIPIDPDSNIPLYQQVQDYLRAYILSGQLVPETRLPSTRSLAKELGISRITIQNAYANLESEGLLANREGSGAYVLAPVQVQTAVSNHPPTQWPLWQQSLSPQEDKPEAPSTATRKSDMISFTGVGDPHHYPVKELQKALRVVIQQEGTSALEYGDLGAGYYPLRETVAHILASQGIQTYPEQVLITSGSQQALALVCQLLLKPGDVILVEEPTYNTALALFRALDLQIVGIPIDGEGMQVEQLEPLLQQVHPKLLYTIPNFQNPSGVCLAGERRRQMLALAERYNVPILEDDFVGDLRYNGRSQPAIKALDVNGTVIYVGTFSKMLMPGLRVGFLVADGPVFKRLVALKEVTDLTTSTLLQRAVNEYVTIGRYQVHLRRSKRLYRQRRDAMLAAIQQHLPADVTMVPPQGGLFMWLQLPASLSVNALRPFALQAGVDFASGSQFFPEPDDGSSFLRLNFATQTPENIAEGIKRLRQAIDRYLQN